MSQEKNDFKVGDVVRLRSGGPKMTINGKSKDVADYFECVWFDKEEKVNYKSFFSGTIEIAKTP